MPRERKIYARYAIVRKFQTLWKGDPADDGSQYRQFVIASGECNSFIGTFQIYGLEGRGKGIKNDNLAISEEESKLLVDEDVNGLEEAETMFEKLIADSKESGFRPITLIEEMEFQAKLKGLSL